MEPVIKEGHPFKEEIRIGDQIAFSTDNPDAPVLIVIGESRALLSRNQLRLVADFFYP